MKHTSIELQQHVGMYELRNDLTLSVLSSSIEPELDTKTDLYDWEEACDPSWKVDTLIASIPEEIDSETLTADCAVDERVTRAKLLLPLRAAAAGIIWKCKKHKNWISHFLCYPCLSFGFL